MIKNIPNYPKMPTCRLVATASRLYLEQF